MRDVLGQPSLDTAARKVLTWLHDADRVLVGAGAGMTVAAGIDYSDEGDFAARFPALLRRGFTARYQLIGDTQLSPPEFWGYWAAHVQQVRFAEGKSAVYQSLRRLIQDKASFVLTSNVDALFARNDFDSERICSLQGDYGFMQCLAPCDRSVWPSRPIVDALVAATDPYTQVVIDESLLPACPRCGGPVFLNVRGGSWFVDDPWMHQLEALQTWLATTTGRLVVFDIGSGFNTPTVVRWPMERLVHNVPASRLVRINPAEPDVPRALGYRAIGVRTGAAEFVRAIEMAHAGG